MLGTVQLQIIIFLRTVVYFAETNQRERRGKGGGVCGGPHSVSILRGHAGLRKYIIRQLDRAHTFMLLVCLLFAVMHVAD